MAKKKDTQKEIKSIIKKKKFGDIPEEIFINLIDGDVCNPYTADIARTLGVSWSTVQLYLNAHPTVNKFMIDRRFEVRDKAEQTINKLLDDPSTDNRIKADLSKWVLKTQDDRYKEQVDVNLGGDINITIKKEK